MNTPIYWKINNFADITFNCFTENGEGGFIFNRTECDFWEIITLGIL